MLIVQGVHEAPTVWPLELLSWWRIGWNISAAWGLPTWNFPNSSEKYCIWFHIWVGSSKYTMKLQMIVSISYFMIVLYFLHLIGLLYQLEHSKASNLIHCQVRHIDPKSLELGSGKMRVCQQWHARSLQSFKANPCKSMAIWCSLSYKCYIYTRNNPFATSPAFSLISRLPPPKKKASTRVKYIIFLLALPPMVFHHIHLITGPERNRILVTNDIIQPSEMLCNYPANRWYASPIRVILGIAGSKNRAWRLFWREFLCNKNTPPSLWSITFTSNHHLCSGDLCAPKLAKLARQDITPKKKDPLDIWRRFKRNSRAALGIWTLLQHQRDFICKCIAYKVYLSYYDHHSVSLLLPISGTKYAPIAVPVTERARNFRWFHQRTASCILRKADQNRYERKRECHVMQQA